MTLRRVVVVAEHASTRMGGEAILPYHYFRLLRARGVDAHLVVHARAQAELEAAFLHEHEHLHFVADQPLQKFFFALGRRLPRRIDEVTLGLTNQMLTQRAQRAVVQRLVVPGTVVHQPISVSPRYPSRMHGLGAPVVIGPLNGGMEYPPAFRTQQSALSRAVLAAGRAVSGLGQTFAPGKREAAVVLVANERTRTALPGGLKGRVLELVENGVDTAQWAPTTDAGEPGSFLFVGRLVDWKALDLVLEALARVPGARLRVVGDGPMREPWQQQATALGLGARVEFLGWRAQAECAGLLTASQALVLPSLYECGGAVVLEAMAMQRPVLATAWGGPADYLDAHCGLLIEPASREALIAGFASGMARMLAHPEEAAAMGRAGSARVLEHFDWERKIDAMLEVYEAALGG